MSKSFENNDMLAKEIRASAGSVNCPHPQDSVVSASKRKEKKSSRRKKISPLSVPWDQERSYEGTLTKKIRVRREKINPIQQDLVVGLKVRKQPNPPPELVLREAVPFKGSRKPERKPKKSEELAVKALKKEMKIKKSQKYSARKNADEKKFVKNQSSFGSYNREQDDYTMDSIVPYHQFLDMQMEIAGGKLNWKKRYELSKARLAKKKRCEDEARLLSSTQSLSSLSDEKPPALPDKVMEVGVITPWNPPYPNVWVQHPQINIQTSYTLVWLDTTTHEWDGSSFDGVFTRSVYDCLMPPLSDFTRPAVEQNQLSLYVVNESDITYGESKWQKKQKTLVKDLKKQNTRLRAMNAQRAAEAARIRNIIKAQKNVKDESGVQARDSPAGELFCKYVDVEDGKSSIEVVKAFLRLHYENKFDGITNPHEIVRMVIMEIVRDTTGLSIEVIREQYKNNSPSPKKGVPTVHDVYEQVIEKYFVWNKGVKIHVYPAMSERFQRSEQGIPDTILETETGPSTLMKSAVMIQKLGVLAMSLGDCSSWEEILMEIGKFLSYSADAAFIHRIISGRNRAFTSIEKYLESRLDKIVCLHNGVEYKEGSPILRNLCEGELLEDYPKVLESDITKKSPSVARLPSVTWVRSKKPVKEPEEEEEIIFEYHHPPEESLPEPVIKLYEPTIVEIPPRVKNESRVFTNPFAMMRQGVDVIRTIARAGVGLESKIKEIPILEVMDEVVCLFIFFTHSKPDNTPAHYKKRFGIAADEIPESYLYKELLNRAFSVHKTDLVSIISRICTVVDTTLMIGATLWDGVDYSTLINPLDIQLRLARVKGLENSYIAGNLDIMASNDATVPSTEDYETEVVKLTDDITSLLRNRAVKPAAEIVFTNYLSSAMKLRGIIVMAVRCRTEKDMPFMIGLYGKPGVGKSLCSEVYISVLGLIYETRISLTDIWVWAPDSNGWDTGATSAKKVLQVTEHDNINVQDNSSQIFFNIARLADTMPSPYNKPDLETKNQCVNMLIGGVFCCNQKDFGIGRVKDPAASARRVLTYEVIVKPEFGMKAQNGDYDVPDTKKCAMVWNEHAQKDVPNEDTYLIQQYSFITTETENDDSGKTRKVQIVTIGKPMSVPQWRTHMLKTGRERLQNSRRYNKKLEIIRSLALCSECANPCHSCSCTVFKPAKMYTQIPKMKKSTFRDFFGGVCGLVKKEEIPERLIMHNKDMSKAVDAMLKNTTFDSSELTNPDGTSSDCGLPTLPGISEQSPPSTEITNLVLNESPQAYQCRYFASSPIVVCKSNIPVAMEPNVAMGISSILASGVRRVTKTCVSTVLHAVFNVYTTMIATFTFMAICPPLAVVIFIVMLTLTMSVETTSSMVANRVVKDKAAQGKPVPYWDTTYSDIAMVIGCLGVLGCSIAHVTRKKRTLAPLKIGGSCADWIAENEPGRDDPPVADQNFEPNNAEEYGENKKKPDIWLPRIPIDITTKVPHNLKTMTFQQVKALLHANTIKLAVWDFTSRSITGQTQAILITSNIILLPVHKDEVKEARTYTVVQPGTGNKTMVNIVKMMRIQHEGEDTDMCFALLNTRFPVRNIQRLLSHSVHSVYGHLPTAEVGAACLLTPRMDMDCFAQYGDIVTETRTGRGYACEHTHQTIQGDCCSPLVTTESPIVVLGFHVSRVIHGTTTYASVVTGSEFERFIKELPPAKASSAVFENLFFDNSIPTCPRPKSDEPNRRVCTRFLRDEGPECTTTPPSVVVIGHNASTRVTSPSEVTLTPLSPFLEKHGWVREHGKPPLNSGRAAAAALQYGSRGAIPRGDVFNEALIEHYVTPIVAKAKELGKTFRMLSYEEALQGVYGDQYVKSMALNKACGGGHPGKKRSRMDFAVNQDEDYPLMELDEIHPAPIQVDHIPDSVISTRDSDPSTDASSVVTGNAVVGGDDLVPRCSDELKREVMTILHSWNANHTCNTVVQAAIKDDPTLLSKIDKGNGFGRTVTSQSTAHHIAQTMVYGDVVGFLRAIPLTSGCYEGVSYQSEDWHTIAKWHMSLSSPEELYFLDADTKKMDLSMCNQDLVSTTEAIAMMIDKGCSGQDNTHGSLARACGLEMSMPILNLYGEYVVMMMNTSGNKLTITYNNISGVQLRTREAYVANRYCTDYGLVLRTSEDYARLRDSINLLPREEFDRYLSDFSRHVRVGSIGDDCLISTCLRSFSMTFITLYFAQKGVEITGSDKTGELHDTLHLMDLSCCQRGFRWCTVLNRIVGPLNLRSLGRSLHCATPSKEKPSIVERTIMRTVLEELSLHGKAIFDVRKEILRRAVIESKRMPIHREALDKDYSYYIEVIRNRYPITLTPERALKDWRLFNFWNHGEHFEWEDPVYPNGISDLPISLELVDPSRDEIRATTLPDRLQDGRNPQSPIMHQAQVFEEGTKGYAPDVLKKICVSNQTQINNIEFITPSSTVDVTTVAASHSAESRMQHTNDTPSTVQTRPVRLKTLAWNVGTTVQLTFDPWSELLANPVIRSKMDYFRFLRANLRIKILIDGNMYHSGQVWAGYQPLPEHDEMTEYESTSISDLVEFSQRPFMNISPRNSQGGEMVLPFIFYKDYIDLLSSEITQLGRMTLRTIVPLAMSNGGEQPCIITIMANFEDVELFMPTTHKLRPLGVINESSMMDGASTGISARPTDHNLSQNPSSLRTSPSVSWGRDESMLFKDLAAKESFIGSYLWTSSQAHEDPIVSFRCSPFHGIIEGSGASAEYHVSPSAWCALPFTYWRGTIEYRFEVICSPQHRGKLFFTWDPLYTVLDGSYNKNYNVIIDVGEKTEHTARIGWGQSSAYLPTITGMSQVSGQIAGVYTTPEPYANGVLTMGVFSPLVLPSDETLSYVHINVYQRVANDLELVLLREPLVGTNPQKNNAREGAAIIKPVEEPVKSVVVNPTTTTARVVEICERPMPYVYRSTTSSSVTGLIDLTYVTALADANMDRVRLSQFGTYELATNTPYTDQYPYVFNLRGFVDGGTTGRFTTTGTPVPQTLPFTLSGITDSIDLVINPNDEGLRFTGGIIVSSSTRFEVAKAVVRLPRWSEVKLRFPPELPNIIDLTPFVNWYTSTPSGPGALLADQAPGGRSGVMFKIRIPDGTRLLGNVVLSYIGNSTVATEPMVMENNTVSGRGHLVNATSGERRHFAYTYQPDSYFVIPPSASISILQLAWIQERTADIRTAIKQQPILVTNQSGLETQHGPQLVHGLATDYFHDTEVSILKCLQRQNAYASISSLNPNAEATFLFSVLKVPHYPFVYRSRLNSNNVSETYLPTLFEYFTRAFLTMRGSMRIHVHFETKANDLLPTYVRVTRSDNTVQLSTTALNPNQRLYSFKGADYEYPRTAANVNFALPWYETKRFAFPRSTAIENHNDFAYRMDLGQGSYNRLYLSYTVEPDFVLNHFLCTPVLRAIL